MAEREIEPHPFALLLDERLVDGHLFGTLSIRVDSEWLPVERRCRLCNRQPIELLTVHGADGSMSGCAGLRVGVTDDECSAMPCGVAEHDAGDSGPERARTR